MIDFQNYLLAIRWFDRQLSAWKQDPLNRQLQLSVLQSFEVTFNLSESVLRQVYVSLNADPETAFISTRELIYRSAEEGLLLSDRKSWAGYGFYLDSTRETAMTSDEFNMDEDLLSRFLADLESFADGLGERLALHA